jgi:hypothetical protein
LGDLGVDGKTILKLSLKNWGVMIRAYGGGDVQHHSSCMSTLDIQAPDDKLPWRIPIILTEKGGWFDTTSGLDAYEKRKFLAPSGFKPLFVGYPPVMQSLYRLRHLDSC